MVLVLIVWATMAALLSRSSTALFLHVPFSSAITRRLVITRRLPLVSSPSPQTTVDGIRLSGRRIQEEEKALGFQKIKQSNKKGGEAAVKESEVVLCRDTL